MKTEQQMLEKLMSSGEYDLTTMPLQDVTKVWQVQSLPLDVDIEGLCSSNINFRTYSGQFTGHLDFKKQNSSKNAFIISLSLDNGFPKDYFFFVDYSFFNSANNFILKKSTKFNTKTTNMSALVCHNLLYYPNITIVCKVTYGYILTETCLSYKSKNIDSNNYKCNAMKLLINDCGLEIPDLFISTNGNCIMKLHSSILDAASSSYQSMIKSNNGNRTLVLPNDRAAVLEMIRFIYTGEIEDMKKVAYDLFDIAHTLNLTALKDVCQLYLNNNMSIENVVDIFTLANKWNIDLENKTLQFMKKNYSEICVTEKFQNLKLSMPNLEQKILSVV